MNSAQKQKSDRGDGLSPLLKKGKRVSPIAPALNEQKRQDMIGMLGLK